MQENNIAYSCLTRHCENGFGDREALHWVDSDLSETSFSYQYFEAESNKIAQVLTRLGVAPGDVVSCFLPRSPILISAFFAILKLRAISCFLFSTLGEDALFDRLENSQARVVITKKNLVRKIVAIKGRLPHLRAILVTDLDEHKDDVVLSLKLLLNETQPTFAYPPLVETETPAFLQYTSGSTGKPKGALHVHGALAGMEESFREIMQLQPDDRYWCTADPAWITGLVYGIIAPLSTLTHQVQFAGGYHAKSWMKLLETQKVTVWYTAPTALRMLMQEDAAIFTQADFSSLKRIYSVGEPLNPEIYFWGKNTFQREIYDTWFQSETGSIMVANRPGLAVKPGSMGTPRSSIDVLICDNEMRPVPAGEQGHLCVRKGWASMFRTYFCKDDAYAEKFRGDIYVTGDLAKKDDEGYIWYVSRADDVINSAGHLIGPFEVESALLEIDEVGDVAVIGVDDPILHQKIIAFIKLKENTYWSRELELKCRIYVSNKVSTVAIPAEFHVVDRIPKNQSGKILRRVLKAVYEGNDPGDLSTME